MECPISWRNTSAPFASEAVVVLEHRVKSVWLLENDIGFLRIFASNA